MKEKGPVHVPCPSGRNLPYLRFLTHIGKLFHAKKLFGIQVIWKNIWFHSSSEKAL
jgi:hypothetical protein